MDPKIYLANIYYKKWLKENREKIIEDIKKESKIQNIPYDEDYLHFWLDNSEVTTKSNPFNR